MSCGNSEIHGKEKCPAKNSVCVYCQLKGHFARVCLRKKNKSVNNVDEEPENNENKRDDQYVGEISCDLRSNWQTRLNINNHNLIVKVDTGADVSVMPENTFLNFFGEENLQESNKIILGPGGNILDTKGVFEASVNNKNKTILEKFFIVPGSKQVLLSYHASEQLGLVQKLFEVSTSKGTFDPFQTFSKLFLGLGNTNQAYLIKLKPSAVPYALNVPRRVPLPLRVAVKEELDSMVKKDVIERVEGPSQWCAPIVIVPKPNNKIRICVDFTQLNKNVEREAFPMPDVETTLAQFDGAKIFSKIDANNGFWQVPLDKKCMQLTTFITPFGRFRFKRLPFGLTTAPEIFQKQIAQLLEDIDGVTCHIDDVIIHGKTVEHDRRLFVVLKRLQSAGWTLNSEKCSFRKSSIQILGHNVSEKGVLPDQKRIDAVLKMSPPQNVTEVKRFMGMVNFMGKFIPNLSTLANPLYDLMRAKNEWIWQEPQMSAFNTIKEIITSPPVLVLYDVSKDIKVSVDSSSYGLGAVMLQKYDEDYKPVAYASRTLTNAEKNYSQIEKEATAVAWGCEKFSNYIIGKSIVIETDHKPLVSIFGQKDLDKLSPRLQRLRIRMMRYSYEIYYTPGKHLVIADTLSRSPIKTNDSSPELQEELLAYVQFVLQNYPATDKRMAEIVTGQNEDLVCSELIGYCNTSWPSRTQISQEAIPYWEHRHSISIQEGILMKGSQIIIPSCLRRDVLDKIHAGHQGITKCRKMAQQAVWWPGISMHLETLIKKCSTCIKNEPDPTEPLLFTDFPDRPWQIVGTDLLKLNNNWYILVADYYSRFIEIAKLENCTSASIILHQKSIFARHGIPEIVRSDSGSQFSQKIDSEYTRFANNYGFQLITSSPKHKQSNGFIESQVKNFKKHFFKSNDPYQMMLNLRTTPLECGYSPAELLMGRKLRGLVPISTNQLKPSLPDTEKLQKKEEMRRIRQKRNFDESHRVTSLEELSIGSRVWVSDLRKQGRVLRKHETPRSYIVQTLDNRMYRRNRKFLHLLPN